MAINVLEPKIYNRIAAGEVVEKPASVVKELVENSIDAGASKIKIEIEEGGIKKICVADNGCGIEKEDLPLAFLPHATSKIADIEDLDGIATLGFRGEALASIASVSRVSLSTKTKSAETGFKISADGGEISRVEEVARLDGTTLVVQNLFFNTPVRAKFLKKPKTEEGDVTHIVEKFMLAHPEINFSYVVDGKEVFSHNSGKLDEVIYLLYGREVYDRLLPLEYFEDDIHVSGFICAPKLTRPNRNSQSLFVNNRYVENYSISACVQGAYQPFVMKGRFPIYIIKLDIPFTRVDVNVHPNKKEVKFDNNSRIFGIVRRAVDKALVDSNLVADFQLTNESEEEWSKFHISNDQRPENTSFDSQTSENRKLSKDEGASFHFAIDLCDEKISHPDDYKKKGIDIINMPDFSSVKSNKRDTLKNRPGGRIFFDQVGETFLHEVELNVQKQEMKDAQSEKTAPAKEEYLQNAVQDRFLKVDAEEIKIVGVVFKTYIIAEFEDSIYVVDQHAMHERQLYDKLREQIEKNNIAKQDLLVPYEFKLQALDRELFESKLENLRAIGFEILNNSGKFVILSVPFVLAGINLSKFIEDVLKDDEISEKTASSFINDKLCQTACKHAIRAGDSISKEEILYLINQIKNGVALCPHGRPIVVRMTKKEFEKMFMRVL